MSADVYFTVTAPMGAINTRPRRMRVAYLSNLVVNDNFDSWVRFEERYADAVVTVDLIAEIAVAWIAFAVRACRPKYTTPSRPGAGDMANPFPEDMVSAWEVAAFLGEHLGARFNVRVD